VIYDEASSRQKSTDRLVDCSQPEG